MAFEGNELIGLFFKAFIIVLLSGVIIIPLVPVRTKSIISILIVFDYVYSLTSWGITRIVRCSLGIALDCRKITSILLPNYGFSTVFASDWRGTMLLWRAGL